MLVVVGTLASETSKTFLIGAGPRFLGKISYSLYLTHMPLLYTIFAALYLQLGRPPQIIPLVFWSIAFFGSALALGWLMTVLVDEPAMNFFRVRRHTETLR
jgi:peptidoglycan/LPS O-acetylase OafA/YrhL